jgi:hypothetical protein
MKNSLFIFSLIGEVEEGSFHTIGENDIKKGNVRVEF